MSSTNGMYKCSECGEIFLIISPRDYAYKTKLANEKGESKTFVQCSYTCHSHAVLRKRDEQRKYSADEYADRIKITEDNMRLRHKEILHPLSVKGKAKKSQRYHDT